MVVYTCCEWKSEKKKIYKNDMQCSIQPNERRSELLASLAWGLFKLSPNWVRTEPCALPWVHTDTGFSHVVLRHIYFLQGWCTAFPLNPILWARLDQWCLLNLLHSLCLSHYRHKYLLSLLQELPVPHMKPVYKSTEEVGPKLSTQGRRTHFSFGHANHSRGSMNIFHSIYPILLCSSLLTNLLIADSALYWPAFM